MSMFRSPGGRETQGASVRSQPAGPLQAGHGDPGGQTGARPPRLASRAPGPGPV